MSLRKPGADVAVVLALIVALAGCSLSGRPEQKAAQHARNDAAKTVVHDTLTKVPGVVKVIVTYCNGYITCTGSAGVNLIVEHGTDFEPVADLAVRALWRSQLDPLHFIRVDVVDDQDRTAGIERGYTIFDDQAELEAKYGPRPVGAVTRGTGRG